ncbi:DUF5765 domain-containing protein [Yoonia sp. SS1-5]|uniref:DUF5765 domain-containing protein n=1 Tax=Yoonia rhodophyticola TaxID=3137370 RepID=A0AAN0M9G0_9RHOB
MCWSMGASFAMSGLGVAATGYLIAKGKPAAYWLPMGYFTAMELLQAASYPVVDQCDLGSNQFVTLLGYIHIAFQPLFFNILCLAFLPAAYAARLRWPVIGLCLVSAAASLSMLYQFEAAGLCDDDRMMCARRLCTYMGEWHLAWELPFNGYGNGFADHWLLWIAEDGFIAYQAAFFFMPMIYGAWRLAMYFYLTGPFLVQFLTDNLDEQPAIWCLLSIAMLILLLTPPLRRHFYGGQPVWMRWAARPAAA